VRRSTNDLNDYGIDSLTLTSDLTTLAVVQQNQTTNFWLTMLSEDASRAREITHGNFGNMGGLAWSPDGKIVFPRTAGDSRDLWIIRDLDNEAVSVGSSRGNAPLVCGRRTPGIGHVAKEEPSHPE
jgi:hypothetical protein